MSPRSSSASPAATASRHAVVKRWWLLLAAVLAAVLSVVAPAPADNAEAWSYNCKASYGVSAGSAVCYSSYPNGGANEHRLKLTCGMWWAGQQIKLTRYGIFRDVGKPSSATCMTPGYRPIAATYELR